MGAFRLSRAEAKKREGIEAAVKAASDALDASYVVMLKEIEAAVERCNTAVTAFNEAVAAAQEFVTEIAERGREAYDEKSEGWQEGDRGQAASAFVEAWESVDLEEIEPIDVVEPDQPDCARLVDELAELPEEAE